MPLKCQWGYSTLMIIRTETMTDLIDDIYFQELSEQDPKIICDRALCSYDAAKAVYSLPVWGDEYRIYPAQRRIERMGTGVWEDHEFFRLFVIYHILRSKKIELANEWISEKDIPGGATFFRGPHEIPTHLISGSFKNDLGGFKKKCERLNGIPLEMGDAAYLFQITPRIPVALLYWTGDDEFPAEARLLYDRTIAEHLTSDIIYALAVGICQGVEEPVG